MFGFYFPLPKSPPVPPPNLDLSLSKVSPSRCRPDTRRHYSSLIAALLAFDRQALRRSRVSIWPTEQILDCRLILAHGAAAAIGPGGPHRNTRAHAERQMQPSPPRTRFQTALIGPCSLEHQHAVLYRLKKMNCFGGSCGASPSQT